MKVFIKGPNTSVDLAQKDYLAEGGEGRVFVRNHTAFKIYHDPSRMIPLGKFHELSAIQDPRVIRPQNLLLDGRQQVVGYTMPYIDGGHPLCQIFPRAFREREGISPADVLELVLQLQDCIHHIHQAQVLVVDCNEMNFLVSKNFKEVFCIDADSYQTKSYPATVLMDSVRDWSVTHQQWSELSDWYSFAILAFQMFIGMHPFRGKYHGPQAKYRAKLPTDAADDAFAVTRRRMQDNISALHPDVGLPGAVYPLSAIPPNYRQWFEAVLAQGKRLAPPTKPGTAATFILAAASPQQGAALDVQILWELSEPILQAWGAGMPGDPPCLLTAHQVYLGAAALANPLPTQITVHALSPRANRHVVGGVAQGRLHLYNLTDRTPVPFDLLVQEAACSDGRIYLRTLDQIHELVLTDAGPQVLATSRAVANVMPLATQLFPGVAIQSLLGATYCSLFTQPGQSLQVRIPELDTHRVLDARYEKGVLMAVSERRGQYTRQVFRFDGTEYDHRAVPLTGPATINFCVLDNGVAVALTEEDQLEVTSCRKGSAALRTIEDPALGGNLQLVRLQGGLGALQGTRALRVKMR